MASATRAAGYGLLISVPAGTALGSGIWLITREPTTSLAAGLTVGAVLFAVVVLGGAYGSADEELAEGP